MESTKFISSATELFSLQKEDLINMRIKINLESFRNEIITHLISRKNEDDYFAIRQNTKINNFSVILETVREELHQSGWKTQLSFNDTGLFIFKDQVPKTCW